MNRAKCLLAVFTAGLGGLCLLTVSKAEDKPAADPPKPAARAAAPAVKPKPLGETAKKGLEYLVKQQHENGGWGQGGGWRTAEQGGRVEGAQVQDPPDVGNTAITVLALVRAGNTPKEGPYAKNVARGVAFICGHIEKADDKSLYVTDVKGTQIQSKIGPYVDTFLAALVLSELKGKMGDEKNEKRMILALNKTVAKMEKNQQKDGTFVGNTAWASVLSQGLANKGFARAAQMGALRDDKALAKVADQVAANFDAQSKTFRSGGTGAGGLAGRRDVAAARPAAPPAIGGPGPARTETRTAVTGPAPAAAPSDAGVPIYTAGTYLTNSADVVNAQRAKEKKAREVLARKDAPREEKEKAKETIKQLEAAEQLRSEATVAVVKQLDQPGFVAGFGSNGGEEFLSFMNISEALLLKGGEEWKKWDKAMNDSLTRIQDKDGSWSGHHCITGKTFCTSAALLVLMADRAPIPACTEQKEQPKK
jgi:hypothetical protein